MTQITTNTDRNELLYTVYDMTKATITTEFNNVNRKKIYTQVRPVRIFSNALSGCTNIFPGLMPDLYNCNGPHSNKHKQINLWRFFLSTRIFQLSARSINKKLVILNRHLYILMKRYPSLYKYNGLKLFPVNLTLLRKNIYLFSLS